MTKDETISNENENQELEAMEFYQTTSVGCVKEPDDTNDSTSQN